VDVDQHTVFEAASLSKPVSAFAILKLIDGGMFRLDETLHADEWIQDDSRAGRITVRHVLSHTGGLPNWRSESSPLKTHFEPGSRFSYSGEGFALLQAAAERKAGETWDAIVDRLVFRPLRMFDSGYVWRESFEANYSASHDGALQRATKFKPVSANAAFSLHTTAGDYGRFLEAVLSGDGLAPPTAKTWLEPVDHPPAQGFLSLNEAAPGQLTTDIAWGLGWGLEPECGTFFHWGANEHARAYVMGRPGDGSAFAAFMNTENGFAIVPEIARAIVPGDHPSFRWLGIVE